MTSSGGWRTLILTHPSAPKLLLKSHITPTGYHVQLTDLCRVWAEKLNKKDIIRRAWDDGCSIDPSEDDKQFNIFLEKIESALNGEAGTTMDLLPGGDNGLQLKLSAELPKGFQKLVWAISVVRQPDDMLADTLTIPLLQQASGLQSQVQQLMQELREKDRVISKITDRLETSGNDLTTVFPGVSNIRTNKKKSQREQLARHVRGLADFDEPEWRNKTKVSDGPNLWERLDGVLQSLPESEVADHAQLIKEEWWLDLSNTTKTKPEPRGSPVASRNHSKVADDTHPPGEKSVLDEDFQRQATPDRLKRRGSMHSDHTQPNGEVVLSGAQGDQGSEQLNDGDSTTEDEDDLDAPPKRKPTSSPSEKQPSPVPNSPSSGPSKKLGTIGGRSSKPPSFPARQPTPEEQQQPSKPRGKLGAIGGKAKAPQKPASPPSEARAAPPSSAPRKMGIIGGKRKPSDSIPQDAASPIETASPEPAKERSRATTKEPTPPPRETSQERADRKRDQLKKELEQKAKAPAKKKRKF